MAIRLASALSVTWETTRLRRANQIILVVVTAGKVFQLQIGKFNLAAPRQSSFRHLHFNQKLHTISEQSILIT